MLRFGFASRRVFASALPASRRAFCTPITQTFLEKAEVSDRVMTVLKNFEKVDPAKVSDQAHFANDLGLDSLDQVEICMAFEEEFCIQIPDAEAEKILTAQDAINFVATHPQAK